MELFRSEEMQLVQLLIPAEAAHAAAAALGDLGLLQFRDLAPGRPAFQRAFASQVQRCDEMGRRLRFLAAEVGRAGLAPGPPLGGAAEMPLDELEARLARLEAEVLELSGNAERLARSHGELAELALVLDRAGGFFEDARAGAEGARAEAAGALPPSSRFGEGALGFCGSGV
jgi:V-type H+-transporting ATPase subunit a